MTDDAVVSNVDGRFYARFSISTRQIVSRDAAAIVSEKPSRKSNESGRARLRERPTPARAPPRVRPRRRVFRYGLLQERLRARGRRREERGGPAPRLGLRLRNRRTVREDAAGRGRRRRRRRRGLRPGGAAVPRGRRSRRGGRRLRLRARRGGRRPAHPRGRVELASRREGSRRARREVHRGVRRARRRRRRRDRAPRPRRARGLGEPSGASVVFVGDAASEYAAGGAGGLGVSVETDDEDGGDEDDGEELGFGPDGDGALDPDVVETFERTAEALENVGEKVEKFGAAVFQNAGRIFDKIVDTFDDDDDDDDGDGARAKPPGSFVSPGTSSASSNDRLRKTKKGTRRDPEGTFVSHAASFTVPAEVPAMTAEHLFDKKVAAMQRDSSTYCDEPADAAAYAAFAATFDAESDDTKNAVEALLAANSFMKVMSGRIVPAVVAYDVFWSRYFFRLRLLERERDAETEAVSEREAVSPATIGSESGDAPRARASPGTPEGASSSKQAGGETSREGREDRHLCSAAGGDENLSRSPRRNEFSETGRETRRERVVVSGDDGDLAAPPRPATDASCLWPRTTARSRRTTASGGTGRACATWSRPQGSTRRAPTPRATRARAEASGEEKMDEPEPEPEEAPGRSSVPAYHLPRRRRDRRRGHRRARGTIPTWTRTGGWTLTEAPRRSPVTGTANQRRVS